MKLRLVLVAIHQEKSPQALPLGVACLAATVKADAALASRVEPVILDIWPGTAPEAARDLVRNARPDLLGFSLYLWNRHRAKALSETVHALMPRVPIILGGPDSFDPAVALWPGVVKVCTGEAESAFRAWLTGWLAGSSPAGKASGADARPRAEDPAGLASPWLEGVLDTTKYGGVLWETARGCPFRCSYCLESRGVPGSRPVPMERLQKELALFGKAKVGQIFLLDPTFNSNEKRCLELVDMVGRTCPGTHLHAEIRAEFLSEAQAEAFATLPCSLQIGLQSADPGVLEKVGRSFKPGLFKEKIRLLGQAGVPFGLDLIWGLPGDTLAGFEASLDWALAREPNHLDMFPLAILPGTRLADEAGELGLTWQKEAPFLVQESTLFSAGDMEKAARLARGVDFLYNRGRAVGWFPQVSRALDLAPSRLGGMAAEWLDARKGLAGTPGKYPGRSGGAAGDRCPDTGALPEDPREVRSLVTQFLSVAAGEAKADLLPAILDLVTFHGALADLEVDRRESTVSLHYDPNRLCGPEGRKLGGFVKGNRPRPRRWRFRLVRGEACWEPLG